jgi:hypothetical protein
LFHTRLQIAGIFAETESTQLPSLLTSSLSHFRIQPKRKPYETPCPHF